MIKRRITTYIIIACILAGCVSIVLPTAKPTIVPTDSKIEQIPSPTSNNSLLLTATKQSGTQTNSTCPTILSKIPSDMVVNGQFLLLPNDNTKKTYLLDFSTGANSYLPYTEKPYLDEFTISPDRKRIAYFVQTGQSYIDSQLVVASTDGQIVYEKPVNRLKEWYTIDTWLNNETIMLERYQTLSGSTTLDTPLPVTVLNPFTRESSNLNADFPNLLPFFEPLAHWDNFGKSGTAYDPTLSLVAYAKVDPNDLRQNIVLWDIQTNREIANIQAAIGFGSGPVWSPDGSKFITDSLTKIPKSRNWTEEERLSEEIYSVSRTGKITRLTYLTDQFKRVSIDGYVWSPDGIRIAFWVSTEPDNLPSDPAFGTKGRRLAILDMHTQIVLISCIRNYSESNKLFWSPNGQQILTSIQNVEKTKLANNPITVILDTILVDLTKNIVIEIASETTPVGWVMKQP